MEGNDLAGVGRNRRVAAAFVITGSLLVLILRSLHGDLPAADTAGALSFINDHPFYAELHVGTVLGTLAWVGGLTALIASIRRDTIVWLGSAAVAVMIIGAAVFTVEHSVDGVAGQGLANAWAADPTDRASLEIAARTAFTILRGPSLVGIIALWGIPPMLLAGVLAGSGYPRWLTRSGVAVGALTVLMALTLVPREDVFPGVLLYGLAVSLCQLWILVVGAFAWRLTRLPQPSAGS